MRRLLAVSVVALVSCKGQQFSAPPPPVFPVTIKIVSDPGVPMPNAQLLHKDQKIGTTNAQGRFETTVQGVEGDVKDIKVVCPAGFDSPSKPIQISLRRLTDNRSAEYAAACTPQFRRVVVVIKAENGPFIPVMHLGTMIGRTDSSGVATFLANVRPNDQLEFTLKTSDDDHFKRHHPTDPSLTYLVQPAEDVVVLAQEFKVDKPPPVVVKGPDIPVQIKNKGPTRSY